MARPFSTTGVDYFGPVYIKQGYRRNAMKAYVSVFVCFTTKATHLELVTDLSTARFIQALRRFTARRGKCATLWSDNGTNFIGARNQMKELLNNLKTKRHHQTVAMECADEGMQWKFIPPGAPHFGGLWEAAVRSAKTKLLKVLVNSTVSYEDSKNTKKKLAAFLRVLDGQGNSSLRLSSVCLLHFRNSNKA
ncbi:uncharacterized protein LOC129717280 [Wyeomyia smithii]|uniref:uncharacterized protein LOC129717280 n=1 Tax=Wyeomyia smithii TaxID=174621 RepID=UPI002467CED1|nr:uncharacterized protein LOC129717280 [Wyeomyia smithii]